LKTAICLILCLLSTSIFGQNSSERLKLLHADVLRREVKNNRVFQRLEGNVEFKQGKTTIKCDVAEQEVGIEKTSLIGHVHIFDEEQSLQADTVYFFQKQKIQIAVGHVKNVTKKDTTTANKMTYYESERQLLSEGDVRIANREGHSVLTAGKAVYFRDREYGKITENPVLVQKDSLGVETTRIFADTMEVDRKNKHTHIKRRVRIIQSKMTATCGTADYFKRENKIELASNPKIVQENRVITGDTLRLFLKNSLLEHAVVLGDAVVTSDADTLSKGRWINKLTGKKMTFYFKDKKLKRMLIEGQATSYYHIIEKNEYKGANEISGDKIEIFLTDDKADKVVVKSSPDKSFGKYRPPK